MGTSLELRVRAADEAAARRAEELVLRRIDRLSAIFSGYDPASEFSRWQSGASGAAPVSPELFEVLRASESWRSRTGGAFDPRVEALSRLWAACARQDRLPDCGRTGSCEGTDGPAGLAARPGRTARPSGSRTARSASTASPRATSSSGPATPRWPRSRAIAGVMLNVGGDLRCRGAIEGTIGIAAPWADSESSEPLGYIEVKDRSVATSGSSQRGFRIGGRWYSHIFDPRIGLPVDRVAAATVSPSGPWMPTPSPRRATCSSRRSACGWRGRCGGLEFLIVEQGRTDHAERRLAPL